MDDELRQFVGIAAEFGEQELCVLAETRAPRRRDLHAVHLDWTPKGVDRPEFGVLEGPNHVQGNGLWVLQGLLDGLHGGTRHLPAQTLEPMIGGATTRQFFEPRHKFFPVLKAAREGTPSISRPLKRRHADAWKGSWRLYTSPALTPPTTTKSSAGG